ncbi:MAG: hypothetical protein WAV00_15635 [Nocardioides sp.]
MSKKKRPHLYPTRKWWATQISATTTLAVAWVSAGHWDKALTIAAIGVASQAAVVYLVPNGEQAAKPQPDAGSGRLHQGDATARAVA